MNYRMLIAILLTVQLGALAQDAGREEALSYPIVDTGQVRAYDHRTETKYPKVGAAFFGQDAHYLVITIHYGCAGDVVIQ